ncbi:MAG TPA: PQQ-binding-like beta-propeller repeat protein, partial [Bryobacteraceae bacterium]|nr:PQQ-binding-like beta-propeller repeat protein [Bryobacteraceae bacterium]
MKRSALLAALFSMVALRPLSAQPARPPSPQSLFDQNCAACHAEQATGGAPDRATLGKMTPEAIYRALASGPMRAQAAGLAESAKRSIAEFLTGGKLQLSQFADAKQMPNRCAASASLGDPSAGEAWNGWGVDSSNTRFQTERGAGLTAAQAPRLKLKWAFGFPGASSVWGQPSVVAGRVFLGVDTGYVYSLSAATGCVYWSYEAEAGVRSAITVARVNGTRAEALFGDIKANVYAVDAETGDLIWKVRVEDHPTARITGAPKLFEGRLYVPVASSEEGAGGNPKYPCCSFRGSIVALDASTGRRIWKTYVIPEAPKPTTKTATGVQHFAPAGGGVWSSPTIDPKRRALYATTGDAYTEPAAKTTDAIVSMDLNTGKIQWVVQGTENDTWLAGCTANKPTGNCPEHLGPDQDFSASPILKTLPNGRRILVAGQKSGNVWAYDPDRKAAVVWKTALTASTTEFGGKIIWGGAADDQAAYFGLGTGGIAAVQLREGERKWFNALKPAPDMARHVGQDGPLTAIPGVVFSGGWDGVLRALSAADGHVLWEYNTVHAFDTVNGVAARGGSMGAAGPTIAGGMLFTGSGYVGV